MKHLKTYKIFESVSGDLTDILLEINDETYWKAECWPESQIGKWVVIIKTVDEDEEYELEGQRPLPIVIESIERAIDFMNGEGFTNYQITFENTDDIYKGGSAEFEEITLDEISDLDVWPNNFIRIEFWK
jgi:hypothetical protein